MSFIRGLVGRGVAGYLEERVCVMAVLQILVSNKKVKQTRVKV